MKPLLSALCFVFLSSAVQAAPGQLAFRGGSWSFATEGVRSGGQTSSGVGAYSFEVGYSFYPKWLVVVGFNVIMSSLISGSSGYGFDLGGKYYPLTSTGSSDLDSEYTSVSIYETWRPYVGLFMRQRLFGLALATSYIGPGASVGVDYALSKNWLVTAEYRYDYLYGPGTTIAVQNNIMIGAGFEF